MALIKYDVLDVWTDATVVLVNSLGQSQKNVFPPAPAHPWIDLKMCVMKIVDVDT